MNTFFIITQHLINSSNEIYLPDDNNIDELSIEKRKDSLSYDFWKFIFNKELLITPNLSDRSIKVIFYIGLNTITTCNVKNKFNILRNTLNNLFYTQEIKDGVFNLFNKVQTIYHKLSRLAFIYKFNKSQIKIDRDIFLNPIDERQKNKIILLQNGYKYIFTFTDIINILNTCLGNTEYFFASPRVIKNPYNNIPFSKSILYNIYFAIKKSNFIMPLLLQAFFLEDFNITNYALNNECIIRDYAIKKYFETASNNILYREILIMLKTNVYGNKLLIDKEFPKELLVTVMKPYLYLFYLSNYSVDCSKRSLKREELNLKLKRFVKFNYLFGRKNITINKGLLTPNKSLTITHNSHHIPFNEQEKNYMKNHIIFSYDEDQQEEEEEEEEEQQQEEQEQEEQEEEEGPNL